MTGNVYCVGRNYRDHAIELGNEVPKAPLIFTKPNHSLVPMQGGEIELPKDKGVVHYEIEIVLQIAENYKPGMKVEEAIDAFTLGMDFTLRDVQAHLKAKGLPWLAAKGFKQSASLGAWQPFQSLSLVEETPFKLNLNGVTVQLGYAKNMIFSLEQIIAFIEDNYGLGAGDIIYTGTPEGVGAIQAGDKLEAFWGEELIGSAVIK